MQYIQVDHDEKWPQLGLGTWLLRGEECVGAVEHALALGYRHIDTAQSYDNESEVGTAVARSGVPRAQVWITTKVARESLHPAHVQRTTEDSLRRLKMDYVDLLLIHWPNDQVPLEDTLGAMQALREEGKTRFIGVSNFSSERLRDAVILAPEILTDQVELHPLGAQYELQRTAKRMGVTLTAYSPLGQGQALDVAILREIGEDLGRSSAQVILRWLMQLGVVAVPKAATPEHRRANLDIFDFELSDAQMQTISELDRAVRFIEPVWTQPRS